MSVDFLKCLFIILEIDPILLGVTMQALKTTAVELTAMSEQAPDYEYTRAHLDWEARQPAVLRTVSDLRKTSVELVAVQPMEANQ